MVQRSGESHHGPEQGEAELSNEKLAEAQEVKKESIDTDVDDILEEIDEVLETNAEEFVRGFIQKGGQ